MKIIFLVGNGFNYLIEELINKYEVSGKNIPKSLNLPVSSIAKSVREITYLWKKFDQVFQDLKKTAPNLSDEELIRMIYAVLDFFSNLRSFEQVLEPLEIKKIKDVFNRFLLDKIKEIALDFKQHQDSEGYKAIKKLFPHFGMSFSNVLQETEVDKFHIYTTNYDGIIDTLLTNSPIKGFITKDGFTVDCEFDKKLLALYPKPFQKEKYIMAHLHGSYRFKRLFGETFKTRENILNDNPVMIFNNPDTKQKLIQKDNVLNEYYLQLVEDMKEFDKLIIFGNSMKNEPHLKELIKKNFNKKGKTIIISSRSTEKVKNELTKVFTQEIKEISTANIHTEDALLAHIKDLISS